MVMGQRVIIQARAGLWGKAGYVPRQNRGLDKGAGGVHLDNDASNYQDLGAPLCAGLDIVLCLLDTLPSFPANLTYQSASPIITGFMPETYAQQPWLGVHSLDLAHTPPPTAAGRLKTFWRRPSSAVQEVVQPLQWAQVRPPPLPQHPYQPGGMPMNSLGKVFPLLPHPQYILQPSTNTPGLLLRMAHGLTLPLLVGAQHPLTDREVVRAHRAHRAPAPAWAAAVGPVRGPLQDPKPAHVRICPLTSSIRWKCWSPLWRWGQWWWGWCLGLCQRGRRITRKYVSAWHLHCRWWRLLQMQSARTCS